MSPFSRCPEFIQIKTMELIKNSHSIYGAKRQNVLIWLLLIIVEIFFVLLAVASPVTAICTVLGIVAILLLITKPEYAFYFLTLSIIPSPVLSVRVGDIVLGASYLVAIILILSWVIARFSGTRLPRDKTDSDQVFIVFCIWAFLSIFWSHDRSVGYEDLTKLFLDVAVVFLATALIRNKRILKITLGAFILVNIIDASLALFYPHTGFYSRNSWAYSNNLSVIFKFWLKNLTVPEGRGMGFFTAHATAVTQTISITFIMMLFWVTKSKAKRRWLFLGALLFLMALVCTLTKSLLVSFIIGVAYVALHLKPLEKRFFTTMILLLTVSVISFTIARFQDVEKAATFVGKNIHAVNSGMDKTSLTTRIVTCKIGIRKLVDTLGLGTGIGGFLKYSPYKHMDGSHPAVLFDLGFVGFGIWIWVLLGTYHLLVTTMRNCRNEYYRRMLLIYLGGYVNILISWLVTFSYADIYIWFYLGIGLTLVQLAKGAPPDAGEDLPFYHKDRGSIVVG